jgi:hypothetical protein
MGRLYTLSVLALLAVCATARSDESPDTFFELKIRPVLVSVCLPCHGGKATKSGLRVDSRASLLAGGSRGPAIIAGSPEQSLLIRAIRHTDDELKMPPKRRLPDGATADFARWVAGGAAWPSPGIKQPADISRIAARHWSFQPIKVFQPPRDESGWSISPIDCFIAARQRKAGLSPVGPADKRTLIRRVTFDLIGLPPTPEEINAFLADESPAAFAQVVDRLLASPHYGERWGRHWMDLARYADTAGDNADYPIPEAALYRDYIINSFNQDEPYDQFVRQQLAGDILARQGCASSYADSIVATGFLALARRYATAPFELWHLTLEDAIETTGRTFLGLSLRCARCHDHKYDPVAQSDYYALYGIFASTTFPYAGSEELHSKKFPRMNFVPLERPGEAEPKLRAYHKRLADLERGVKALATATDADSRRRHAELNTEWTRLKTPALPCDLPGSYAVMEGKPADVALQRKGEPGNEGPVVARGVPRRSFLGAGPPHTVPAQSSGRLELARWLTQPGHPLTARVMVNRIWQYHFGRGIVASASNFGVRGEPPSHPELLDCLAARFVAGGWSIKAMHRALLLSRTYQLSSDFDSRSAALDPIDRLLWRFPPTRLDAESIRDAMLAASGALDRRFGGRHPFPSIEQWHWTQHDPFKAVYPTSRRSVYLMTQRLVKHPFLAIFDGPDTNASTDVRARSTVPLQALFLMNNPFVQECADELARRVSAGSCGPGAQIVAAHELAWGRPPDAAETARATDFLAAFRAALAAEGSPPRTRDIDALTALAKVLLTSNEFLYID